MSDTKINRLKMLRDELSEIQEAPYPNKTWDNLESWIAKATPIIRRDWTEFLDDFQKVSAKPRGAGVIFMNRDLTISDSESRRLWKQDNEKTERVRQGTLSFLDGILALSLEAKSESVVERILFLCQRFPIFARELRNRQRGRLPIEIQDEYDVQYLLLALLRLHFDDIRPEVWTPNYAGGSARMDFLLKKEKIVVEVKKTSDTLSRDSHIADQLIVDIERYAEYPDCELLICFIYDPARLIDNPKGIEQDLSGIRENIEVLVVISPRGI